VVILGQLRERRLHLRHQQPQNLTLRSWRLQLGNLRRRCRRLLRRRRHHQRHAWRQHSGGQRDAQARARRRGRAHLQRYPFAVRRAGVPGGHCDLARDLERHNRRVHPEQREPRQTAAAARRVAARNRAVVSRRIERGVVRCRPRARRGLQCARRRAATRRCAGTLAAIAAVAAVAAVSCDDAPLALALAAHDLR
jgi:hypothetical protein